jgi:MFS family permease
VLIVAIELWLISITRRLSPTRTIAVGYLLVGFGFALSGAAQTIPMLALVVIIFTIGEMVAMPIAAAYITDNVAPEMRGRYMGVYGLVWALGLTFGPSIGLRLHTHNPTWLWSACAALGVIAACTVLKTAESQPALPKARAIVTAAVISGNSNE